MSVLEQKIAALEHELADVTKERDGLRASYRLLQTQLDLIRRRIFVAKAERIDTAQLELEFAEMLAELDAVTKKLDENDAAGSPPGSGGKPQGQKERKKPVGRRDLRDLPIEERRIELIDPVQEALVAKGEVQRIGFEESSEMMWQRGGHVRYTKARVKYAAVTSPAPVATESSMTSRPESTDETESSAGFEPPSELDLETGRALIREHKIVTARMPPQTFPRCLAAPSLIAHIVVEKFCDGLPLFRIEERFKRDGIPIDRGTLCRWVEDAGATLGATIVEAMRKEALSTAFCIATDATGVAVQPARDHNRKRGPCKKGHYLIQMADTDHVFFEYLERETSVAIDDRFKGFSGYVQADAKSVFDLLFMSPEERKKRYPVEEDLDESVRVEVGCWYHARRKFWEAAFAKHAVGREGVARIGRIFALEARWRGRPPEEIQRLRDTFLRPHVDAFFAWASSEYERVQHERGYARSALGYVVRQKSALTRFFEDGRLVIDNNRSERGLRKIAVGRKAWLFVGSDDHAVSAGNLFSLIGSCRLHGIDPEAYLRDVICILAQWPKDRYLELAPKYWKRTRARLVEAELEHECWWYTIPPPLFPATEQQVASS